MDACLSKNDGSFSLSNNLSSIPLKLMPLEPVKVGGKRGSRKNNVSFVLVLSLVLSLSLCVIYRFGFTIQTTAALIFTFAIIILSYIDIQKMLLPDAITLPCLWLGLFLSIFSVFKSSQEAILGAVLGYLFLWSVYWIYKLLTQKEGLGYGDFKLLAMIGAWVGWKGLFFVVLFSSVTASIVGLGLVLHKRKAFNSPIPFGPFIALGGWLELLQFC